MKTSTLKATPQDLPTFQQMVALAITKAEMDLKCLINIRCTDDRWSDDDNDTDFAVELAASHVEQMKGMKFETSVEFDLEWYKAAGALNLASKAFSREDCVYARFLSSTCKMFEHMAILVEFAQPQ